MSLVNEMLNELQKEKSKGGNFDGLVAVNNDNKRNFWFKNGLIFILVVVATISLWMFFLNQQDNKNLSISSEIVVTTKDNIDADSNSNIASLDRAKVDIAQVKNLAEKTVKKSNQQNSLPTTPNDNEQSNEPLESLSSEPATHRKAGSIADSKLASSNKPKEATSELNNQKTKKAAATEPPNKRLSKLATKLDKKSVIRVSRKSIAEKELRLITSQWSSKSAAENKTQLDQFLHKFSDLDTAWLAAINLLEDKDLNYHQQLLDQALNTFPGQPAFRMIVVKQKIAQNNYANALSELQRIDSKHWQQNQFRVAGFLAQKVNDHVSAIKFYNQLLKNKPNQGDINMAIAISLEALNENGLAVAKFQRALEDSSLKPIQRQFIAQRIAVLKG